MHAQAVFSNQCECIGTAPLRLRIAIILVDSLNIISTFLFTELSLVFG